MIQSIKTDIVVGEGPDKELRFDYSEEDDMVYLYLDNKHLGTMDFEGNLKQVAEKIIEKW